MTVQGRTVEHHFLEHSNNQLLQTSRVMLLSFPQCIHRLLEGRKSSLLFRDLVQLLPLGGLIPITPLALLPVLLVLG